MSQHHSGGDQGLNWLWEIIKLTLMFIFGLLLISQFLTRLLFQFVLNPLLDGLLDRHDGAVVLLSAGLWGGIAGFVILPLMLSQDPYGTQSTDLVQTWLGMVLMGLVWGVVIGVRILTFWWAEAAQQMPGGYDVVQLLDTPIEIRLPAAPTLPVNSSEPSMALEDHELEQLILGDGFGA